MELWYLWVVLGVIFFVFEIFTPGFIVATFGFGCLAAAFPAYFHSHFLWQLFAFSAGTLAFFFTVRPLYLKYLYPREKQISTNAQALIGQKGVVIEAIDVARGQGRVKVGGEDWKASCRTREHLAVGTKVRVSALEGVTLFVEPIEEGSKQ